MRMKHLFSLIVILLASFNTYGQGVLTPSRAQQNQQSALPDALPVSEIRIKVSIEGQVATVRVEHLFRNDTDETLEGTYYYPTPEGATLLEFAVFDGDQRRVGRVKEKGEANAAYTTAAQQGDDPALLEMTKRGWFQSRVNAIAPHSDKRVELIYSQILADKDGVIAFDYPLGRGYKKLNAAVGKVEIEVDLRSEVAIKNFFSPTHPLDIRYDGELHATAKTSTMGGSQADNFQLLYSLSNEEIGISLITYRRKGEDGYFLLMLSPKIDFDKKRVSSKDVLFVIDVSLSMEGEKIRQAKEAIRFGLTKTLSENDRFNIIAFAGGVQPMQQEMIRATPSNIRRAIDYVDKLELAPATNINDALVAAMKMFESNKRLHNLVFLTDGQPNVSATDPAQIAENVRAANQTRARLFAFGVGNDVNRELLEKLSANNLGASFRIADQSQLGRELSTFFSKVSQPVLSDLAVSLGPVIFDRIHPAQLPDLYTRSQIKIFGRYKNQEDLDNVTATLYGKMNEQPQRFDFNGLHFPLVTDDKGFLPKLWATERVSALLAEIRVSGERSELKQEIIELARQFNLVTPYTSMYVPTAAEVEAEKQKNSELQSNQSAATQNKSNEAFSRLNLLADLQRAQSGERDNKAEGAGKSEQVTVTAASSEVLQSAQAEISQQISALKIAELPINGRQAPPQTSFDGTGVRPAPGAVVDNQGAAIANATVTFKDENTGARRTVTTDSEGNYTAAGLPPGKYQVEVQAPGFNATTVSGVEVQPGQSAATGVTLTPGAASETVTVTGVAQAVDVSTSHISANFQSNEIRELPSLAPAYSFSRLAAGVNSTGLKYSTDQPSGANRQEEFLITINGGRPLSTGFMMDGRDDNGIDGRPAVALKSFDAIEMLHILTTRGDGDASRNYASSINLITRNGTNDFHGSLFDYHLNRRLGALSPLERRSGLDRSPKFKNDIFGGTFGGPVIRDRLFFFGSFFRETETSRRFVDSTSSSLTPTLRGLDDLARAFPGSATVADLLARGPATQKIGEPFFSRTASAPILGSEIEFGEIVRNIPSRAIGYEGGGRVEFQLTNRDRLESGYWLTTRDETNSAGNLAAGFANDQEARGHFGSLRWTRLLSPQSTNEAGISFNKASASFGLSDDAATRSSGARSAPAVNIGFRALGYGTSPSAPGSYASTLVEISDTLSHLAGRHNLKLGGQARIRRTDLNLLPGTVGQFNYASFEDFVLDNPASIAVATGGSRSRFSQLHHHFFIDDAWRVRNNLTLSIGLSYENHGQPYNQLIDRIRKREADPALALFGAGPLPLEKIDRDNNNIAPRFGFAYTPRFLLFGKNIFGYDKTVIRGGVSLSYDQTAYGPLADASISAPNILLGVIAPANADALPAFPAVSDANQLRTLLGASPLAYARTQFARGYRDPSSLSWHLDISRDLDNKVIAGLSYVGAQGTGLIRMLDGNPFSNGSTGAVRFYETSGRSIYHSIQARADLRLTDKITSSIAYTFSKLIDDAPDYFSPAGARGGNSTLLSALAIRSIAQNPFDDSRGERSVSSLDRRHNLTASFLWDLPLRRNQSRILGRLLGGWKAAGVIEMASGSPFTPFQLTGNSPSQAALFASMFSDRSGTLRPFAGNASAPIDSVAFSNAANSFFHFFLNPDGSPFSSPTGFIIADSRGFRAGSTQGARFIYNDFPVEQTARLRGLAPDAFGKTFAAGRPFGDAGRNTLFSPRLLNVNFALIKNTKLTEKVYLQFRAEFFNLFNHPNRARPNMIVENAGGFGFADFGETDASPRRIRLALKLIF